MAMTIVGIARTEREGKITTTLHVTQPFDAYYTDSESGRSCEGEKTDSIYVGTYDCTDLEVGQQIEVYYGKAVTTSKGTFQPVAMIRVLP